MKWSVSIIRKISYDFIEELKGGILSSLLEEVKLDDDLDLQIRKNYINIYYKGFFIAKIEETGNNEYPFNAHEKIRAESAFNKDKLIISDGRDMKGIGFYKDEQPRQKIKSKVINILPRLWTTL